MMPTFLISSSVSCQVVRVDTEKKQFERSNRRPLIQVHNITHHTSHINDLLESSGRRLHYTAVRPAVLRRLSAEKSRRARRRAE